LLSGANLRCSNWLLTHLVNVFFCMTAAPR
jgi:hypothetical protein